jgi:hypothetical protein
MDSYVSLFGIKSIAVGQDKMAKDRDGYITRIFVRDANGGETVLNLFHALPITIGTAIGSIGTVKE